MTAKEIRKVDYKDIENRIKGGNKNHVYDASAPAFFLREIAAQLAELNDSLKNFEKTAEKLQLDFLRGDVR